MNPLASSKETRKPFRRAAICLTLACLAAFAQAPSTKDKPASQPVYQVLGPDLSALRERFNEDAGHPRILMLLSPT